MYIPPFKVIRARLAVVTVNGKSRINNSYDELLEIMKLLVAGVAFDEQWYLRRYADVAEAVAAGVFNSGHHHFVEVGYFEGRSPHAFEVDEKWYVETYPDIAEGIRTGKIKSAEQHFNEHGYAEGRRPSAP